MPDRTFYRHSGIHACPLPDPCCMTKALLCVHIHAECPCPYCMSMSMLHVYVNIHVHIEMPECRTVRHPVSPVPDWKKLTMPEQVQYRTKLTQSGIFLVRYRTKSWDAGMSMPALVSSMPMPSYANKSSSCWPAELMPLIRPTPSAFVILCPVLYPLIFTRHGVEFPTGENCVWNWNLSEECTGYPSSTSIFPTAFALKSLGGRY